MINKLIVEIDTDTLDEANTVAVAIEKILTREDFPHGLIKVRPIVPHDDNDKRLVELARARWAKDGEIEIDDDAVVSQGDDAGAYVGAWVWVCDPTLLPDHDGDAFHLELDRDEDMLLRHLDVGHGIDPNTHEVGADLVARHQNEHEADQR